jgi:hypothetical protein
VRSQTRGQLDRQLPVLAAAAHQLDTAPRGLGQSIGEPIRERPGLSDDLVFGRISLPGIMYHCSQSARSPQRRTDGPDPLAKIPTANAAWARRHARLGRPSRIKRG